MLLSNGKVDLTEDSYKFLFFRYLQEQLSLQRVCSILFHIAGVICLDNQLIVVIYVSPATLTWNQLRLSSLGLRWE